MVQRACLGPLHLAYLQQMGETQSEWLLERWLGDLDEGRLKKGQEGAVLEEELARRAKQRGIGARQ